ncbi:MAG TPA: hypothetical protein VE978_25445 [Chitinophagales bacterium]|nr:hypothetical protein [Chitinophagales bacterium]
MIPFFVALAVIQSHAQQKVIVFQNIFSGKKIELKAGDEVHLRFTVHDTADAPLDIAISDVTLFGTIESVNDSSILLVSKNKTFDRISLTVPLNSIEAFRKYSSIRPVLKAATTIVAAASGLLISLQISSSDEIFSWQNAGLAVGTTSAAFMSRKLFSDKMKYFMVEGWRGGVVMKNCPD